MLRELNVEVQFVKGFAGNERHAWNLVKVDNQWYHVDATWDDPVGNKADEVSYKFFMVTDSQLSKTHSWTKGDYPVAKSDKYKSLQVATSAFTNGKTVGFLHVDNKTPYKLDLATMKAVKISKDDYNKFKN